jgi:hypothetical protein
MLNDFCFSELMNCCNSSVGMGLGKKVKMVAINLTKVGD